MAQDNEQHIHHHYDNDGARISVKVEKNTKGFNYEISISGSKTVEEALALLKETQKKLEVQLSPFVEGARVG